jgi:hypothetical protein
MFSRITPSSLLALALTLISVGSLSCGPRADETCAGGFEQCGGRCTQTAVDPSNCGTCGHACSFPNGIPACSAGECYLAACRPGFVDIDRNASNGCEQACTVTAGGVETCDGVDNDCDGVIDNGFDLASDPSNCGTCGHACSFPNGIPACSAGVCYLIGCADTFGNPDKRSDNGCECTKTNGGVEICDGVDNDCDGVVDQELAAPGYVSVCDCSYERFVPTSAAPDQDSAHPACTTASCTRGADDATPTMVSCCDASGAWAPCKFLSIDLSGFDADASDRGVLQVVVDVSGNAQGLALNLSYGTYPKRKRLPLLTGKESWPSGSMRITKYFLPEDAECPAYLPSDINNDQAFKDFPLECTVPSRPWSCEQGKWTELSPQCAFDYRDSIVYLTAENCLATSNATASIAALRYYPDLYKCRCVQGSTCKAAGSTCDMSARLPAPWCSAGTSECAGICTESAPAAP